MDTNNALESIFGAHACVDIFWLENGSVLKFLPVIDNAWRSFFCKFEFI